LSGLIECRMGHSSPEEAGFVADAQAEIVVCRPTGVWSVRLRDHAGPILGVMAANRRIRRRIVW